VGTQRTSILFLSADPTNASRLRLGQELRDIQARLRLANADDAFELHHRTSVRPGDLTQAIFDAKPAIIHFSGHGSPTGELLFENDAGTVHPVAPAALEEMFALFKDEVRCVILNACYSWKQAMGISKHIEHVIGMTQAIEDDAAVVFSVGFYKALAAGRSIRQCFGFGLTELRLSDISCHQVPVLLERLERRHVYIEKDQDYWIQVPLGISQYKFPLEYEHFAHFRFKRGRILVALQAYECLSQILDDLYMHYLREEVPIFSYGESWLLEIGGGANRPLIPWDWYSSPDEQSRHRDMLSWARALVTPALGMIDGSTGQIVVSSGLRERYSLVATNSSKVDKFIRTHTSWKGICMVMLYCVKVPFEEFDAERYRYKILITRLYTDSEGKHSVYVDNGSAESEL